MEKLYTYFPQARASTISSEVDVVRLGYEPSINPTANEWFCFNKEWKLVGSYLEIYQNLISKIFP